MLEDITSYLKIYGSEANFQHLHDSFDLQDRPLRQFVIVMELTSVSYAL
jgi:hypothetical protein